MRTLNRARVVLASVAPAMVAALTWVGCSEQHDLTPPGTRPLAIEGQQAALDPLSGQRAFGQSTVEPATNSADGSMIFLLTPNHAPFPSKSSPRASAPMFIPMYPVGSSLNPEILNCQPHNCDHLNVLPFPAPGYPNGGTTCAQFGFPVGGCSLVLGHDHLIGVQPTGDFNIAWHVILLVFTPQGVADGAINNRALTLQDVRALEANGDAFEASTPITFNCSIVASTVYLNGTPLTL